MEVLLAQNSAAWIPGWADGMEMGQQTDVVMDFVKAFDKVNCPLLDKLHHNSVRNTRSQETYLLDQLEAGSCCGQCQVRLNVFPFIEACDRDQCLGLSTSCSTSTTWQWEPSPNCTSLLTTRSLMVLSQPQKTITLQADHQKLEEWDFHFHPNKCSFLTKLHWV